MKTYKPSGIAPIQGILIALAFAGVAGLIAGGLLWFFDHKIGLYLILLFPAVAGFIVAFATSGGVDTGKIRNPLVAGLIGLLGGVLALGVYHYLSYEISFKDSVKEALAQQSKTQVSSADVQKFSDEYLRGEVGDTGFMGFLKDEAKQGISITRSSSSSGIELKDGWAWGYFIIEGLIIAGLGVMMSSSSASEPFDERANAWYGKSIYLGGAGGDQRDAFVNALKGGAFEQAGSLVRPERAELGLPRVELHARLSPDANADQAVLEVKSVKPGNKKDTEATETLMTGLITREELLRLKPVTV
jgi:hypothetical protein